MPRFNDAEARPTKVPPGDYVFLVVGFEKKISQGGKTSGCDQYDLKLELQGQAGFTCYCSLIDHESISWKIDTFLKSAGVKLAKGTSFDFAIDRDGQPGIINPIGLQGWCNVQDESYTPTTGKNAGKTMTNSRVQIFYTDKPKLPRVAMQPKAEDDIPF